MDMYQTPDGWLLIVSGFSYEFRHQALQNILECVEEFGLDGKLSLHHNGEQKGLYYCGPYDTITLLLHPHSWIQKTLLQKIKKYYLDFALRANK